MGMPDFDVKAITEGKLFIQQIIDHYGNPPAGGELRGPQASGFTKGSLPVPL